MKHKHLDTNYETRASRRNAREQKRTASLVAALAVVAGSGTIAHNAGLIGIPEQTKTSFGDNTSPGVRDSGVQYLTSDHPDVYAVIVDDIQDPAKPAPETAPFVKESFERARLMIDQATNGVKGIGKLSVDTFETPIPGAFAWGNAKAIDYPALQHMYTKTRGLPADSHVQFVFTDRLTHANPELQHPTAYTSSEHTPIVVYPKYMANSDYKAFPITIAHELGHAWGLEHATKFECTPNDFAKKDISTLIKDGKVSCNIPKSRQKGEPNKMDEYGSKASMMGGVESIAEYNALDLNTLNPDVFKMEAISNETTGKKYLSRGKNKDNLVGVRLALPDNHVMQTIHRGIKELAFTLDNVTYATESGEKLGVKVYAVIDGKDPRFPESSKKINVELDFDKRVRDPKLSLVYGSFIPKPTQTAPSGDIEKIVYSDKSLGIGVTQSYDERGIYLRVVNLQELGK